MFEIETDGCPIWAPFVGFIGVTCALVFASESASHYNLTVAQA